MEGVIVTKEQKFYQWFRDQCSGMDVMRVENTTMGGVPDVNICSHGQEIWVELKVYVGGRVLIRPDQFAWGHRRAFHKGNCFIVAYHPAAVHVWKFPHIVTIPRGKYLSVTTKPFVVQSGEALINFLFTR